VIDLEIFPEHGSLSELGSRARIERLCALALASAGIDDGHLAIELVDESAIAELNERHRGKQGPTDVLSFPIDGSEPDAEGSGGPPRELGDIVICVEHTLDLEEAVLHGVLHLLGMDHETDEGEMLALQAELLRWARA
jgi:probable rRNA maturation factor